MTLAAGAILVASSLLLFAFGLNLLHLSWRSLRLRPSSPPPVARGTEPPVCVQLPIYNERHVAERVIDAACRMDWPRDRLQVQVLDDSDDETVEVVARAVGRWRARGVDVTQVRRPRRTGYKAGALAHGMELSEAPYIAIFDADFVPPACFLRQLLGAFEDPGVGFAQARWGHLNESYSWFTRVQALAIDFHFLVEQAVRSTGGCFTNFTGTAGAWRRTAIVDAGGWSAATLTEDLDLSYRAQLRGWKAVYVEALVVPEELPVDVDAYRRQQSRWATGSFQAAVRLLVPVLASPRLRPFAKCQAVAHLLAYGVGPLMLLQLACYPFLLLGAARRDPVFALGTVGLALNLISAAPWIGFVVAQVRRGRSWWHGLPALLCQLVGAGMAVTIALSLVRAARPGGEFQRTPKYRIVAAGQEWRHSAYVRVGHPASLVEALAGLAAALVAVAAARLGVWLVAVYSALFAAGLLGLAGLGAAQALRVLALRRLGWRALRRLLGGAPVALLLAGPALLLSGVALVGDPFEDSYHHWLIAAYLAQTGHLRDPLFGMEDSWLPGYQLLAAAVLRAFGLWQLGLLKALNVALALATLAAVHRLAGSPCRGRLAVLLLALNPVFLLTATSTVAEPLLLACLLGALVAASSRRPAWAALLAASACAAGTKAWLFVLAVALVHLLGRARRPLGAGERPSLAWAVPALALLAVLEAAFGPAGHSVARAAVEATSAAARGSLPATPGGRLGDFSGYFALASLPLLALAPLGLVRELRDPAAAGRLRLLHLPSGLYLAAVLALVAAGAYSGSHRYYYLALPSLAILAAAALERERAPASLLAVGAAGLVAIAYLPTFTSFAAGNGGLLAAGSATAGVPGGLLTDSPVAAYASRKPPDEIVGSQALPANPDQALGWLSRRGVTSLVLEDVDYYRASAIFPALVRGEVQAPFSALGGSAARRAPGGKAAFAYVLGPPSAGVFDDLVATLGPQAGQHAGKTAPLQKGVTLAGRQGGLAGEGMGFGVPIARYADGWHYSGSAETEDLSRDGVVTWRKTFELDTVGGDSDHGHRFVARPSVGRVQVTYRLDGGRLRVEASPLGLAPGLLELGLLNEQGAAFDDYADASTTLRGTAFGPWVEVGGSWARLRSRTWGIEWSLPRLDAAELHAGRERRPPELDWSGLDYQFGPGFAGAAYTVTIARAR